MDGDGDFVVTWESFGQGGGGWGIYAQRFDAGGHRRGGEFRVDTFTAGDHFFPAVAKDVDGDFVIAWEGQDGSGLGIFARRFSADGLPQGAAVRVNAPDTGGFGAAVAMDADGDFTVAWAAVTEAENVDVYARRFGPNERPTTSGIPPVNVQQDAPDSVLNLRNFFDDSTDADELLAFSVVGNTNAALFSATPLNAAAGTLTLDYAPGRTGQATLTVRAADTAGLSVDAVFTVTVTPAPDTAGPRVTAVFLDGTAWTAGFRQSLAAGGLGSAALGFRVDGAAAQLGGMPWANVDRVRLVFSEAVVVDVGDLSVRGVNVANYVLNNVAFAYDAATFTASWALLAPFGNDRVRLDLNADAGGANPGVTDAAAAPNRLDGEWADGADAFPSGDGSPGGDFRFRINVLPGDADGSGAVNVADLGVLATHFNKSPRGPRQGDFNGDAKVDVSDLGVLSTSFNKALPAGNPSLVAGRTNVAAATPSRLAVFAPPRPAAGLLAGGPVGRRNDLKDLDTRLD
jgi:hypothetical protein